MVCYLLVLKMSICCEQKSIERGTILFNLLETKAGHSRVKATEQTNSIRIVCLQLENDIGPLHNMCFVSEIDSN